MKKWYENKTDNEVMIDLSRLYHNTVACIIQGDITESKIYYGEFKVKVKDLNDYLSEMKSFYYGNTKGQFERYESLQGKVRSLVNELYVDMRKELKDNQVV